MPILFGLTLAQLIGLLPEIIQIIQAAQAVYKILVGVQKVASDKAVQQSMTILGKAVGKLLYDAIGEQIPMPHKMTPEEEKVWMDARNPNFNGG